MCWFLCWPNKTHDLNQSLLSQESPPESVSPGGLTRSSHRILMSQMDFHQQKQMQQGDGESTSPENKAFEQQQNATKISMSLQIKRKHHLAKNYHRVKFKTEQNTKINGNSEYDSNPTKNIVSIDTAVGDQSNPQGTRQVLKIEQKQSKPQVFIPSEKQCESQIAQLFENSPSFQYIYTNNKTDDPIFMFYKCKKVNGFKEPLYYHLQKTQDKLTAIIGKSASFQTKRQILKKFNDNIWMINYCSEHSALEDISIDTNSLKMIRWQKIQRIIILVDNFRKFKQSHQYILAVTKHLSEKQKKKISYLFPSSISIESISKIMNTVYSSEIKKIDIHKYVSEYCFDLHYFETGNLGMIMVQPSLLDTSLSLSKIVFYNSMTTCLSILGKHFNHEKYYLILKEFYHLIKRRPSTDLLLLRKLFNKSTNEFRSKIRQVRNWDNYELLCIQHENFKANFPWSYIQGQMVISQQEMDRILGHLDGEQKRQSPKYNEDNAQWDDNLQGNEISLFEKPHHLKSEAQNKLELEKKQKMIRQSLNIQEDQEFKIYADLRKVPQFINLLSTKAEEENVPVYNSQSLRKKSWDQ